MAKENEILDAIENHFIYGRLSVDRISKNGTAPLHTVASLSPSKRSMEIATELISLGADINIRCSEGRSPVSYAIVSGNYEVLKVLINNKASISNVDLEVAKRLGNIEITHLIKNH